MLLPENLLIYENQSLNQKPILLYTYDDKEIAEEAFKKLSGEKRLTSERDSGETVYNLFGVASWKNLYELNLYNLKELEQIVKSRESKDMTRKKQIFNTLCAVAATYNLKIPAHWFE